MSKYEKQKRSTLIGYSFAMGFWILLALSSITKKDYFTILAMASLIIGIIIIVRLDKKKMLSPEIKGRSQVLGNWMNRAIPYYFWAIMAFLILFGAYISIDEGSWTPFISITATFLTIGFITEYIRRRKH